MSTINDAAAMLKDGNRSWNCYLGAQVGVKPAMVFSSLVLKAKYYEEKNMTDSDGWFYCTIEDLYQSTMLKYKSQTSAIKKLVELKLIEVKTEGLFNKRFFRIVADGLNALIEKGKKAVKGIVEVVDTVKAAVSEKLGSSAETTDETKDDRQLREGYEHQYGSKLPQNGFDEYKARMKNIAEVLDGKFRIYQLCKFEYAAKSHEGVTDENVVGYIRYCYGKLKGRKVPNPYGYLLAIITNTDFEEYAKNAEALSSGEVKRTGKSFDEYMRELNIGDSS